MSERTQSRLSRRQFLKGAAGAAGAVMAGSVLGGCGPATPAAVPATPVPTGPLKLVYWGYHPEIVEESIAEFKEMYGEEIVGELVRTEYHPVLESKFIGGDRIDFLYGESDHMVRWLKAGWIRDLEGLPGVDEIKKAMYPVNVTQLSTPDGKLCGLPYYSAFNAFVYNAEHLDQAGLEAPETWDEVVEQCREIKSKGIAPYPYLGNWRLHWSDLSWNFFAHLYSVGEPMFDEEGNPTFKDNDQGFRKILGMWKLMMDEELVPADILTLPENALPAYMTGNSTFIICDDYNMKPLQTMEDAKTKGKVKLGIIPGTVRETRSWSACYYMGARAYVDRAWELLKFFGYKSKEDEFQVVKKWVRETGLGTSYKEVMESPEIAALYNEWRDNDLAMKQLAQSRSREAEKNIWFPEWNWNMMVQVQDYLQGKFDLEELATTLHDSAVELKKKYPSG